MQYLDGRTIARSINAALKQRIGAERIDAGLAAVLVGDDPASRLYVGLKEKACGEVGIRFQKRLFRADVDQPTVLDHLARLNADARIHAILVQLPLPRQLDEDRVIDAIDPRKDVDGFQLVNVQRFVRGEADALTPVLVKAIWRLLEVAGEPLAGKRAAIVSNAPVFAEPIIAMLKRSGVAGEYVRPKAGSRRLKATTVSDILIVALGRPNAITNRDIKPGAIIIDVGTTQIGSRMVGDVDATSVQSKAAWLTPVPGGVGPVTVACLLENVVELAERQMR
ncbi:MAG: bifunctional 5,10-methylenetetrahydrofolate dehydrogenase/5,10-methenyltetrahydrofolate cyclohydrolase [Candidatus Kerfeldbacteria bacterium]|nr:bifunctional 5,10-methylenetetrahydrofolate dehydrogenase/5,10-methenyltetrahydrofolate cyclohydrolase [Candidatus Kerfeldbacteria bacterium]